MFSIIAGQMISFAIMLGLGAFAGHRGTIRRESVNDVIAISLKLLLPIMVFSFVYKESNVQGIVAHIAIVPLTLALYAVLIGATRLVAHLLHLSGPKAAAWRMTFLFGNTGFIGLPVLSALFPNSGAVSLAMFMTLDQAIFWTYGVYLAGGGEKRIDVRSFAHRFANHNIIAVFGGLALACLGIRLPDIVINTLSAIGAAATSVCMVCLGAMFCFADRKTLLNARELIAGVGMKMLALPLLGGFALSHTTLPWDVIVSFTALMAMPATTLVPLTVQSEGGPGEYASVLSVASIAISVVTMPLVFAVLWG